MRAMMLLLVVLLNNPYISGDSSKRSIKLNTEMIGVRGLTMPESDKAVYRMTITGEVGEKGEGRGKLILDLTEPPTFDELGLVASAAPLRELKLDCEIKQLKTTTREFTVRVGGPGSDKYEAVREHWTVYSISGPKIKSRISLALLKEEQFPRGRILIHEQDGKVKHAINLIPPPQEEPCHPGCFPEGTVIHTPSGTTSIERIRVGDIITTIGTGGKAAKAKVEAVFATRNHLIELKTEGGTLVTTQTQPLSLEAGGYRLAADLKAGDRVLRWNGSKPQATTVLSVSASTKNAQVFNLILGAPTTFIAGEFLVRSKPPIDSTLP
jgi:hypothetical protein